jgi:DNA-binding transcriptional MerR regulator
MTKKESTICFLKELGISLKDIAAILRSDESKEVITLLLEQRAADLEKKIADKNEQLSNVKMLVPSLFMEALEVASLLYAILRGNWAPFAAVMVLVCIYASIIFRYWHRNIMYICPQCHTTFKPKKREAFFARHTAKTRKLTCQECNKKMWCVETYEEAK